LVIVGVALGRGVPVILFLGMIYEMGRRRGREEATADLVTKVNEGKVEFDYVGIVPKKTPHEL
jgi:hypothetical protein